MYLSNFLFILMFLISVEHFFDSSFNSILFDIINFSFFYQNMSYLFTKLTISLFLAKYVCFSLAAKVSACFSLAAKASAVKLLNYGVVIYLSRF